MNVENFNTVVQLWKKAADDVYGGPDGINRAFHAGYFESMMMTMFAKLSLTEREHYAGVLLESSVFEDARKLKECA